MEVSKNRGVKKKKKKKKEISLCLRCRRVGRWKKRFILIGRLKEEEIFAGSHIKGSTSPQTYAKEKSNK